MIDAIFDRTNQVLEKAMALRMARHNLLASNVANAETPNYRAVDIDFQATMENWVRAAEEAEAAGRPPLDLQKTDSRHFSMAEIPLMGTDEAANRKIVFAAGDDESIGNDNNSASLEMQLTRMQSNATAQTALAQLLGKRIGSLAYMIERTSKE